MTLEKWKLDLEKQRRDALMDLERLKVKLNRIDVQLAEPEKFGPRALKAKEKYQRRKSRSTSVNSTEVPPRKKDLGDQVNEAYQKMNSEKKKFDPLDI